MFIEAKKIIGLPLAAIDAQSKVGEIEEIIADPENGHILGFLINVGFFSNKIISSQDISEWDPNGIITETEENLLNLDEIVRIKNILERKINIVGMKAVTESGKNLGFVEDYLIDTANSLIAKYYIKNIFKDNRVISSDKVIKIDKNIIFQDDEDEEKIIDADLAIT